MKEREQSRQTASEKEQGNAPEKKKPDRAGCLALLREMQERLTARGEERYPRRSDFLDYEVVAIKAFLGPWPRALEAAGLKPPRADNRLEKNREKRIRAKRNRRAAKRVAQSGGAPGDVPGNITDPPQTGGHKEQ